MSVRPAGNKNRGAAQQDRGKHPVDHQRARVPRRSTGAKLLSTEISSSPSASRDGQTGVPYPQPRGFVLSRALKRTFDVLIALVALVLLWPLLLIVALAIRLNMGPPVLFQDERAGLYGKPFKMMKFRTMTDERDRSGQLLPDALRLTGLGAFLRRTSIDELPQLWCVVKGDMSLIGPRPLPTEYLPLYTREQARRHQVRPGLVGWASVKGRNANTWEKKFELDLWYVDHRSVLLDLKIFLMAIGTVISGRGVSEEGHPTARKFTGQTEEKRSSGT